MSHLEKIVDSACSSIIKDETYSHETSKETSNKLIEQIINSLKSETKGFKFIVHVTLLDKSITGPKGIRSLCGAYWNSEKDGLWNHKWSNDQTEAIISLAWISA